MFQKILVPVDLADPDFVKPALDTAVELAGASGGAVRLINVIPMTPVMLAEYVPPDFDVQQRGSAEEALAAIAKDSGLDPAKVSTVVRQGGIYHEVLEEAKVFGCDVIVMSSHRPAMKTYFLGSNAGHMVRYAKCSVLVVRKPALPAGHHSLRDRVRTEWSGPVAAKEVAGLPQEQAEERRDESGAAPGADLERAHNQSCECKRRSDKNDHADPVENERRAGLKDGPPAGSANAPAQFGDESPVARIEPLVLHHALPRGGCDGELWPVGPDFSDEAVILHRHGTKSEPNAPDLPIRGATS